MQRKSTWIALAALLLALAIWIARAARPAPYSGPYRNVIVVSLDTTRADHLGCYGNERMHTPNIDRLAREGVVFRSATTAAPTTLASHTSIMTGVAAHTHGVVRNGFVVAAANETMAEILKREDFTTAAFLGSFALDRCFGFDRGFDFFDDHFDVQADLRARDQDQRRANLVTDSALRFVEGKAEQRLFLFVHYFDVHAPYEPPPPFEALYPRTQAAAKGALEDLEHAARRQQMRTVGRELGQDAVVKRGLVRDLVQRADGVMEDADRDLEALYSGEISFVDSEIGRLFDELEKRGMLERSLVILVADHGETFAEHGDFWNHGLWVYDTTVHVPLIVRLPRAVTNASAPVSSVDVPVSTIDILPTVLELLGIERSRAIEGESLVRALRGEPFEHGPTFSEATQPPSVENAAAWGNAKKPKCIRDGAWKYIEAPYLDLEELFDLEHDPEERHNLLLATEAAVSNAARVRADALRAKLDAWSSSAHPLPSHFNSVQQKEVSDRLKQLGYVSGEEEPDAH